MYIYMCVCVCVCVHVTESLCCPAETNNVVNQLYFKNILKNVKHRDI